MIKGRFPTFCLVFLFAPAVLILVDEVNVITAGDVFYNASSFICTDAVAN